MPRRNLIEEPYNLPELNNAAGATWLKTSLYPSSMCSNDDRFFLEYCGSVAVCIDWNKKSDYAEPTIATTFNSGIPQEDKTPLPCLEDCLKLFTAKVKRILRV